jgi:hypothetical protein
MLTILQQPQALTFVGNIPDLIAQTDGLGMSVNISKGATLILAEYYTADADGRTRIPLREFLEDQLKLQLPTGELFEQTKSVATFTIEIISGTDSLELTFVAIAGGSSTLALDCPAYLLEAWLTWQPQVKRVKDIQPEWLSYFAQHNAEVHVMAYFSGGATHHLVNWLTLTAGEHYTINVTFADLRLEFVDQPIYIDLWVENLAGAAVVFSTYRQRYILSTEYFEFDDFFLFKNSVGGIDTIRFTGERQATNPIEIDTALFMDEFEQDYQVNPRLAFEKNTGWFRSRAELLWTMDFFQSVEKYYYTEEAFAAIRLINPEFTAPEYILTSLDFKFSYIRQTIYLSLFKKKSPLIDPVIIGPGDYEFYLPPTISDFPQQTYPSGLLFPVQKPGTPGWFFITWANMLADVLANLPTPFHNASLGIQGGKPAEGLTPAEHFHLDLEQWEKVNNLQDPAPVNGVSQTGTVTFNSPTDVDVNGFNWIIAGIAYVGGDQNITGILGTPEEYNRRDFAVGNDLGQVIWISGTENPDQVLDPTIPEGTILLARVLRTPAGTNTPEVTPEDLTDFVSKSQEALQPIKSQLRLEAYKGSIQDVLGVDANGLLRLVPPSRAGVYTTIEGDGGFSPGWSKALRITIDPVLQVNYVITFQLLGVTPTYEKGDMWVIFKVDAVGDILTNSLQLFGAFTPERYKLIKVDSTHYELYFKHDQVDSLYSFRPIMLFGNDWRYEFFQQSTIVASLPVGTGYDFTAYGGGLSLPPGGTSNQVLTKLSESDGDAGWETVKPPLHIKYTSQSLMLEDQVNQLPGYAYFDGLKEWRKLETSTEVIDDYREIGGGGGAAASITTIWVSASTDPSVSRNVNIGLVSNTKITLIGTYETTIAFKTIYRVKQAYSGGRILTWAGKTVIWQGGAVPIVDTEANSVTFINLYWDGSDLYGYKSSGF